MNARIAICVLGAILLVLGATAPALSERFEFGPGGQPRPNSNNTIWDSQCAKAGDTVVVSGFCVSNGQGGPLLDFGPSNDLKTWSCHWAQPALMAFVGALCTK